MPPEDSWSFVVPAHNESDSIEATVRAIRASADAVGLRYEVLVVDDASTDDTAARATAAGARVVSIARRQIAAARNAGAAEASGRTLVFVDADTTVTPAVMAAVAEARAAGAVGGGAVVTFDEPLPPYARLLLAPWVFAYFRLMRWAAGCFVFADRETFGAIGGFDERYFASEEVHVSRALKKRGRFAIIREPVLTSGRKLRTHSAAEIFGALVRIGLSPSRARRRSGLGLWYGERRTDRK